MYKDDDKVVALSETSENFMWLMNAEDPTQNVTYDIVTDKSF